MALAMGLRWGFGMLSKSTVGEVFFARTAKSRTGHAAEKLYGSAEKEESYEIYSPDYESHHEPFLVGTDGVSRISVHCSGYLGLSQ